MINESHLIANQVELHAHHSTSIVTSIYNCRSLGMYRTFTLEAEYFYYSITLLEVMLQRVNTALNSLRTIAITTTQPYRTRTYIYERLLWTMETTVKCRLLRAVRRSMLTYFKRFLHANRAVYAYVVGWSILEIVFPTEHLPYL